MSMQVINEDEYTALSSTALAVTPYKICYRHTYVIVAIRTLVDPSHPQDLKMSTLCRMR